MLTMTGACVPKYKAKMREAAFRHKLAAETLLEDRRDVAGYLYGIAAECALKQVMIDLGVPGAEGPRSADNPYFAHFSALKTLLRDDEHARRHHDLRKFAENSSFMQDWDITMRYSDGKAITEAMVGRWKQNVEDVFGEL
ncbi:hypothetical protein [Sphingobium yanoikuyae]|nr:hypothetical protein [Sphingobium yanoikuyae]